MDDNTSEKKYSPISIKALAGRVSPKLGKIIPGFLYRKLEKLLHL